MTIHSRIHVLAPNRLGAEAFRTPSRAPGGHRACQTRPPMTARSIQLPLPEPQWSHTDTPVPPVRGQPFPTDPDVLRTLLDGPALDALPLDPGEFDPFHKVLLANEEEEHKRQRRERCRRHQEAPVSGTLIPEREETQR
jgi:hypothetical protein